MLRFIQTGTLLQQINLVTPACGVPRQMKQRTNEMFNFFLIDCDEDVVEILLMMKIVEMMMILYEEEEAPTTQ